jgi:predicted nucleic acid-binding protein
VYKKIFLDANVLLDYADKNRIFHEVSSKCIKYCLEQNLDLYTSCDLITTIYYVVSKKNKTKALEEVQRINNFCNVIEFSNKDINQTCDLMLEDSDYKDLEDTVQYLLAKKCQCDLIVSNDENFVSKSIKLISSSDFCNEFGL